jgi:chemotaxis methyl-accepting protein methylase
MCSCWNFSNLPAGRPQPQFIGLIWTGVEDFTNLGEFHIIFCRNVAIYFNEKDRHQLFRRLIQRLDTHGVLIIGSMESLGDKHPQLKFRRRLRAADHQLKN